MSLEAGFFLDGTAVTNASTVPVLRTECARRNLDSTGRKSELQARLVQATLSGNTGAPEQQPPQDQVPPAGQQEGNGAAPVSTGFTSIATSIVTVPVKSQIHRILKNVTAAWETQPQDEV